MWEEFKLFIKKGNIITLAIGFIFGLQFNAVVKSLTDDVRRVLFLCSPLKLSFPQISEWKICGPHCIVFNLRFFSHASNRKGHWKQLTKSFPGHLTWKELLQCNHWPTRQPASSSVQHSSGCAGRQGRHLELGKLVWVQSYFGASLLTPFLLSVQVRQVSGRSNILLGFDFSIVIDTNQLLYRCAHSFLYGPHLQQVRRAQEKGGYSCKSVCAVLMNSCISAVERTGSLRPRNDGLHFVLW